MIRWMCGVSMKDGRVNEVFRKFVGVSISQLSLEDNSLRWYRRVMRKSDKHR